MTLRSKTVFVTAAVLASGCKDPVGINHHWRDPQVLFSDHGDGPTTAADITDLHAFVVGKNLVIAMSTNPAVPRTAGDYHFPTDVTFEINVDNDSEVFDDPGSSTDVQFFGGTIVRPDLISEDVTFRIRFGDDGVPSVERIVRGNVKENDKIANLFAGLRDDPFIRSSRNGRNVGAIVIEVPLPHVLWQDDLLLIWATTAVDGVDLPGEHRELFGRPFGGGGTFATNSLHPSEHLSVASVRPNVLIYDTSHPALFPNGRALTDDVVDLACLLDMNGDGVPEEVGICAPYNTDLARAAATGVPPATTNDLPFLSTFPYLAHPHPPAP